MWINIEIEGDLEISTNKDGGVIIIGNPSGLKSLARIVKEIADYDQEKDKGLPVGERTHVHLNPKLHKDYNGTTAFSVSTEICRLDAKGTGEYPKKYKELKNKL